MKKITVLLFIMIIDVINIYSIEKINLEFKSNPYLFETTMESPSFSLKLTFTCSFSRLNDYSLLKFLTSPQFSSTAIELNESFSKINKAFESLVDVEINVPIGAMVDSSGVENLIANNKVFAEKIVMIGKEIDKPSLSLASTYITYILVFSVFNTILPDIDNVVDIPNDNYTLNAKVGDIITKTNIIDYRLINSREYAFPEMDGVKLFASLKSN